MWKNSSSAEKSNQKNAMVNGMNHLRGMVTVLIDSTGVKVNFLPFNSHQCTIWWHHTTKMKRWTECNNQIGYRLNGGHSFDAKLGLGQLVSGLVVGFFFELDFGFYANHFSLYLSLSLLGAGCSGDYGRWRLVGGEWRFPGTTRAIQRS